MSTESSGVSSSSRELCCCFFEVHRDRSMRQTTGQSDAKQPRGGSTFSCTHAHTSIHPIPSNVSGTCTHKCSVLTFLEAAPPMLLPASAAAAAGTTRGRRAVVCVCAYRVIGSVWGLCVRRCCSPVPRAHAGIRSPASACRRRRQKDDSSSYSHRSCCCLLRKVSLPSSTGSSNLPVMGARMEWWRMSPWHKLCCGAARLWCVRDFVCCVCPRRRKGERREGQAAGGAGSSGEPPAKPHPLLPIRNTSHDDDPRIDHKGLYARSIMVL
jgi:hypothetical protein